jgi:hypothetical protein
MAKKTRVTKFEYTPSNEERKAMSLCNKNGLIIYPIPQNNFGSVYRLHVYGDGYDVVGSQEYDATKDVWYKAMYRQYVKLKEKENYE